MLQQKLCLSSLECSRLISRTLSDICWTLIKKSLEQGHEPRSLEFDHISALHVMVASYTWGKDADRFDGLSSDELIAKAVEDVAAVHGQPVDLVKKNLRDGVVKQWSNDQFTLGGFALFSPSQVSSGS